MIAFACFAVGCYATYMLFSIAPVLTLLLGTVFVVLAGMVLGGQYLEYQGAVEYARALAQKNKQPAAAPRR